MSSDEHERRRDLLGRWVQWLFDGLVIPALRAHFYATESSTHKNRVFYYRKPLWKDMQGQALAALRDAMYTPVGYQEATSALQNQSLGYSYVRMVPKAGGMRCLVNMSRQPAESKDKG